MPYGSAVDKANIMAQRERQGLGAPLKPTQDVQDRIEEIFTLIEEKTSSMATKSSASFPKIPTAKDISQQNQKNAIQSASIVSDAIKRSVFGVFSRNYKAYKALPPGKNNREEIWKSYFTDSKILNDVQRCLLYFNLPFDDIISKPDVEPHRLFGQDLTVAHD